MKWNTLGQYARRTVRELSDLLTVHKTSVHRDKRIDAAAQTKRFRAGAPQTHEHGGKPTHDQHAALNTWEDEGGRTAARAKDGAIQEP